MTDGIGKNQVMKQSVECLFDYTAGVNREMKPNVQL
jgi:hypothetical protein